jgi:amino acid adenylation domain-containing protein
MSTRGDRDSVFHAGESAWWTDLKGLLFPRQKFPHVTERFDAPVEAVISHLSPADFVANAERRRLAAARNLLPPGHARKHKCVHQLFEEQADRTPDAVALVFGQDVLTYRALDRKAEALAERLRAIGVHPGSLVALFLNRSPDMVAGMLGVLKAGGAYIPLDPSLPLRRLAYMMADAAPLAVLTEPDLLAKLPPHRAELVLTAEVPPSYVPARRVRAAADHAADLAYVIYTSGSTGTPKGVEIEHGAVATMLAAMRTRPGLAADDVMAAITTLSFDIALLEIFLPLITGARLVLAPAETARDGRALAMFLEHSGITVLQATPATLRMLLDAGWHGSKRLKILCGGEAWTSTLANALLSRSGSLWNMYGPTETTVWSAATPVKPGQPIVIGPPIAGTSFHILDEQLQPVPMGAPGELHIGGDGLARGYHNRPALTAEKFVPNPFPAGHGARLYKTGDLARYHPDGGIEYLGRIDHQVKIRGRRIELGEIESALIHIPGVHEAVVTAREDDQGEKKLTAYLVADKKAPSGARLRKLLGDSLPDYMVPSALVMLDRLPLTPSGKVDRNALPEPLPPSRAHGLVPPASATEAALAPIWREIVGARQVSVHDDFFELGGHSLMGVRLIERINRSLNGTLVLADLFRHPTVRSLASAIDAQREQNHAAASECPAGLVEVGAGSGRPLFCLPGLGATTYAYHLLWARMGTRRPVLAIELHGLGASANTLSSMTRMAEEVAERIRKVQPEGPYALLGYSFGGHLAVEVSRALIGHGQVVESLIVLDAYAPGADIRPKGWRRLAAHWRAIGRSNTGALSYISARIRKRIYRPKSAAERRMLAVKKACLQAYKEYTPQAFSGRLTLVNALMLDEFTDIWNPDGSFGWGTICEGGVDVIPMACHHLDFFKEPHIGALAAHLNRLLSEPAPPAENVIRFRPPLKDQTASL